jgi:nucleotide-binding universal stress UspA family protein
VPAGSPEGDGGPHAREIVVGVDGGECGLSAARWAAEEAARRSAPLLLMHAAPYLGRRSAPGQVSPELQRARRITAQAYTVARHAGPGVEAETEVVQGDPVTALLQAAGSAQLVVLGISTTGALDELVKAPVAQRIVSRSRTPVVVVPRRRGPDPTGRPVVAILGLGDRDDDPLVIDFAAGAAGRDGRPLMVLRTHGAPSPDLAERYPDLTVDDRPMPGASPDDLLRAACPAPLMVTSAGHGGFPHRLLDNAHRYLLRHCTSPLALVPAVHRPDSDPHEEIIAVG